VSGSFYEDGLRFECTRCSRCCRFDPGYVFLSYNDLNRLLHHTGLEKDEFLGEYCRAVFMQGVYRLSLKEKRNYDCIFWSQDGCEVYDARPLQCRSFPFWPDNLTDRQRWDSIGQSCPGINRGTLHSSGEVESWMTLRESEPIIVLKPGELAILEKEPV